jgi:hypothetical protein
LRGTPATDPSVVRSAHQGGALLGDETSAVLHTIEIAPDELTVTLLWRGSAPALRPYIDQELAKIPLQGRAQV